MTGLGQTGDGWSTGYWSPQIHRHVLLFLHPLNIDKYRHGTDVSGGNNIRSWELLLGLWNMWKSNNKNRKGRRGWRKQRSDRVGGRRRRQDYIGATGFDSLDPIRGQVPKKDHKLFKGIPQWIMCVDFWCSSLDFEGKGEPQPHWTGQEQSSVWISVFCGLVGKWSAGGETKKGLQEKFSDWGHWGQEMDFPGKLKVFFKSNFA